MYKCAECQSIIPLEETIMTEQDIICPICCSVYGYIVLEDEEEKTPK
jgi:hypothetical protein